MISYYLGLSYCFLPVSSCKLAARGVLLQHYNTVRAALLPTFHARRQGRAHARTRGIFNIMIIMRNRKTANNISKTIG